MRLQTGKCIPIQTPHNIHIHVHQKDTQEKHISIRKDIPISNRKDKSLGVYVMDVIQ